MSPTDANGTPYAVDLSKTAAGYRIVTPSEAQTHAVDCMMSFAYWDQRFLQQKRLLNTQTGAWILVEVQSLGESQLTARRMAAGLRSNRPSIMDGRCVMRWRRTIGWPRPSALLTRLPPGDDHVHTDYSVRGGVKPLGKNCA